MENAGDEHLIHGRIPHGGIGAEIRAFLNAPEHAPGNAEPQNDHGLRAGKNIPGIILLRTAFKPVHRRNAAEIGAEFFGFLLHFLRCNHASPSS